MDVTKPCKFIGFGAMDVTKPYIYIYIYRDRHRPVAGGRALAKPYKSIGFGDMDVTKPYEFIGFGAMDVTKPYKIYRVWGHGCHQTLYIYIYIYL
jgi:hypothetical protein